MEQKVFAGIERAIDALVAVSDVDDEPKGKQIYVEGESVQRVLYLVLGGSVDLSRNGKRIATLGRGEFIGEFPLLDPAAKYTVSVLAIEPCCIARVPWPDFAAAADTYPKIWRNMAAELAQRLRGVPTSSASSHDQSVPKNIQEAVVRLAWRLPHGTKILLGVLIALCAGLYLLWQSLPDGSRTELLRKFGGPSNVLPAAQPTK